MGILETAVKRDIRRTKINKAILTTLVASGGIAIALVAPNVLGALGKLGVVKAAHRKQNVKKSFNKLVERGYIAVSEGRACLTSKGEKIVALMGEGRLKPKRSRRWDGKWRILVFDIPERQKGIREQTRHTLMQIGFLRLQDSVWVYPYDCEDLITIFKTNFHLGRKLLYIIADRIEHDTLLRKKFNL